MKRALYVPILTITGFLLLNIASYATEAYPSNWFVNMKYNKVQVLLRSADADFNKSTIAVNYPGVQLQKTHHFENGHYIAVDVEIGPMAKPGNVQFKITTSGKTTVFNWPLLPRRKNRGIDFAQGLSSADLIYFLMPDRFSNGDPTNDQIPGLKDQSLNRSEIFLRHGGDLQGVANHLDYMQKLGVTSLWMTPVVENDMPDRTEHGYAATNNYKTETRFGGDKAYLALSDSLHKRGMKLIQDIVYNHFGRFHFLVQDAPDKNWLHQWPTYTQTHYREQAVFDPYHSAADAKRMIDGWFTTEMPDINHEHPMVEKYLTQNAIWSVETFGVDAFRV
ncbi:MAG: alpha-amylase family glycosyl hydrolase, partial [Sediminibacterium sp.]